MTGKHSGHCSIRENGPFLNPSDTTVAEILQRAGYSTALFGACMRF
jgi:arylsulfatase A-like enzyme